MKIIEFSLLQELGGKLTKLLSDNDLDCKFNTDQYPITLSIFHDSESDGQLEMDDGEPADDGSARDAKLDFVFVDGDIVIRVDKRLEIPDSLMSKIKGLAKKMHYMYLQAYFHQYSIPFDLGGDPARDGAAHQQDGPERLEPGRVDLLGSGQ